MEPGARMAPVDPVEHLQSVQAFRVADALRCTLMNAPKGPNLACPREALTIARPSLPAARLWKDAMLKPRKRVALTSWQGARLSGLASARARSGPRAWEIDGLYLPDTHRPSPNGYNPLPDVNGHKHCPPEPSGDSLALVEELLQDLGQRSAERVFLRINSGSPAHTLAQRSGFVVCYGETLLTGQGLAHGGSPGPKSGGASMPAWARPRLPADDHGLFQLFCASTPVRVRQALGITFDRWQDAQEADHGRIPAWWRQEWVTEHSNRITGWVRINGWGNGTHVDVEVHPDHPELMTELMDFALARGSRQHWLVPEYREAVADALCRRGFRPAAEYTMMVKMVAVPALSYGMAPVEA